MKTITNYTLLMLFITFFIHPFVTAQVDYETEIQTIFNNNCTLCHGGTNGVTLSSYSATMNSVGQTYGTNIVDPGNPDQSPIVDKIEPNPTRGERMPQGGPYLSDDQIQLIRQWIEEGANQTAVSNELLTDIPQGFELIGNYPNPFNPGTVIQFKSPQTSRYKLSIYNSTGVLVQTYNGITGQSNMQIHVDLSNQPSGVYLYSLQLSTGGRTFMLEPKKMTLIK